ncbi:MAG TPA: DinB family protein [Streptosporangiaceae bacterium]
MDTEDETKGAIAMTDTNTSTATLDAERTDLLAELATMRSALAGATAGLTDAQAGERPTASALCLGGLVKHVASMEDQWARFITGDPAAMRFALPDGVTWADMAAGTAREVPQWAIDHQDDFGMRPGETLAGVLERYRRVAARTEEVVAAVPDLSAERPLPDAPWNEPGAVLSMRRVLTHLISETAQHAGHADILRESLDGKTAG